MGQGRTEQVLMMMNDDDDDDTNLIMLFLWLSLVCHHLASHWN